MNGRESDLPGTAQLPTRGPKGLIRSRAIVLFVALAPSLMAQITLASGENLVAGSLSGSHVDTWQGDGITEAVLETESGGKPSKRYSFLEHRWTFVLPPAGSASLHARTHHAPSGDGDDFHFEWSVTGQSWDFHPLFTVTKTVDDGGYQSATLGPGVSGTVTIRVIDTDRTPGHRDLDQIFVDHMYIESSGAPTAPSLVVAFPRSTSTIALSWFDNSTNEDGFIVERATDGTAWVSAGSTGPDTVTFLDSGLAPASTSSYRIRAFNGSGSSTWSEVATATTLTSGSWSIETVDPVNPSFLSLALDSTGDPHIAYAIDSGGSYAMKYAHLAGPGWSIEAIPDPQANVGRWVSLGLDAQDDAHLVYFDDANWALRYGLRSSGAWSLFEEVAGRGGTWCSLALDAAGTPQASFKSGSGNKGYLMHARRSGGSWNDERVQRLRAHGPLDIDGQGEPHIAYYADGSIWRARRVAASWVVDLVAAASAQGVGENAAIRVDPATDLALIAFHDGRQALRLARETSTGSWTVETIALGTYFDPRLVLDDLGKPHVAFMWAEPEPWQIGYARWTGSSWEIQMLAQGYHPALALDAQGAPDIAFWQTSAGDLGLAHASFTP